MVDVTINSNSSVKNVFVNSLNSNITTVSSSISRLKSNSRIKTGVNQKNPLLKILVEDKSLVLFDNITSNGASNIIVDGDIIRNVSDSLSSFTVTVDNNNGLLSDILDGGEYIDFYLDYYDRSLSMNLYDKLSVFCDASEFGITWILREDDF